MERRIDITTTDELAAAVRQSAGRSRGAISAEVRDRLRRRECGQYPKHGRGRARLTFFVSAREYRALEKLGCGQASAGVIFLLTGDVQIPVNVAEMTATKLVAKYRPWAKYRRRQ